MPMRLPETEPVSLPFTIAIDLREKNPWRFIGMQAEGKDKGHDLIVPIEMQTLKTGDYQIKDDDGFALERKSLPDFVSTIARNRDRFTRELERLQALDSAHVVVEAEWGKILERCDEHTRMPPKALYRSVLSWTVQYDKVHWHFCPNRTAAERTALRLMILWRKHRRIWP